MDEPSKVHPRLQLLIPVAEGLVQTFGKSCEVAIHDLRVPENSLVFVAGTVTSRKIGAPVTNIVLESLRKYGNSCQDLIGYKNVTKDGRILKSSTIFVRDDDEKIIGCLCINYNISELIVHKNHMEQFMAFGEKFKSCETSEFFASDITEVLENMIEQVISKAGAPASSMQKDEKIDVVLELDSKGVFLIKGAVDKVAAMLGVSRYTIYNYLEEGRSNRANNKLTD
ncbi:MAG: transcriptional regulator [Firmicutes bacterium]|nr:transcriptional regulator [Bacillota bacterium]